VQYPGVRTRRDSKAGISFLAVYDGSCFDPVQAVINNSLPNYNDDVLRLTTGCSVIVTGTVVASPGQGQSFELQATSVEVTGWVDDPDSSVSKCYFTRAKSGVLMKSVTIAIRNRDQRVIGLLCINMNLDVPFSQIMNTFIPPETPDVGSAVNFASSVEDLVTQTLEFTIEEVNADRNVSNNAKNRQIVLNLYEKGIFDIKDAINQVADRLNISKHTVYLYIRQFKSGDFLGHEK
jgi:predicted transcriptional regulator YheO